jgi:exopolysaccharide production protein ExoQ
MTTVERIYVPFALLCMARGVIPIVASQGDESQIPKFSAASFILQATVFAILAVLIWVHWKPFVAGIRASGFLLILCVLAVVSAGWSSEHFFSLRRAVLLLATTMLGIYIASRFDLEEQLNIFGWFAMISVIGSFAMAIFVPQYGISHDVHFRDWKGLFPHKNALGQQMAFGILVLAVGRPKELPRGILGVTLLGAVLLLVLSHSATSVSVVVVISAIYATFHLMRLRRRKTLPLWLALTPLVLAGVALVAINLSFFFTVLGRDATLTGRTAIWSAVIDAIQVRPWFGYGYGVFWRGGVQGDASDVLTAIHWTGLQQAQSGYLDLCLDLGLVGFAVFLSGCAKAVWRGLKLFRSASTRAGKWPFIFLIFFLAYNLVESSLLQLYTFMWVPYASVFVSLALMDTAEQSEFKPKEQSRAETIGLSAPFESSGVRL